MTKGLRAVPPTRALASADVGVRREYHELWFALARTPWRSVVFVPADADQSAAEAATAFAAVGKEMHDLPVTLFVMANAADYALALDMVKIASSSAGEEHGEDQVASPPRVDSQYGASVQLVARATSSARSGKMIIAVQPIVSEPRGLAVTQASDLVVLCVRQGHTRLSAARRTLELVGREHVAGCLFDHG